MEDERTYPKEKLSCGVRVARRVMTDGRQAYPSEKTNEMAIMNALKINLLQDWFCVSGALPEAFVCDARACRYATDL
ncbi:MAG: hypothetical protein FWF95_02535 [Syntrophorhabdaceae bacterium]|nr:hypothetical protein [Syntrophorhabdaceae bacterium]